MSDKQAIELVDRFIRNGQGVGMINGMDWFSSVNKAISDLVVEEARERVAAADPNAAANPEQPRRAPPARQRRPRQPLLLLLLRA